MKRLIVMVLGGVLIGFASLVSGGVAMAQVPPTLVPRISADLTSVQVDVEAAGFFGTNNKAGHADGQLLLTNTGTAPATGISVTGYYEDGTAIQVTVQTGGAAAASVDLPPNASVLLDVSFEWSRDRSDTGWFVAQDAALGSPPAVVPFQICETIPGSALGWILLTSAILGLCVMLIANAAVRKGLPVHRKPRWSQQLGVATTWSFKDSWASNATALGAILGIVLGTSGFLSDVLPGLATGVFVGMSLLYGTLVLIAPITYTAINKEGSAIYGGVLAAGWLVIWATLGELLTAAELVAKSVPGLPVWSVIVATIVLAVLLLGYSRVSLGNVVKPAAAHTHAHAHTHVPAGGAAPAPLEVEAPTAFAAAGGPIML